MTLPRFFLLLFLTATVACVPPEIALDDFRFSCTADAACPSGNRCGVEGDCVPLDTPEPVGEGGGDDDLVPGGDDDPAPVPEPSPDEDPIAEPDPVEDDPADGSEEVEAPEPAPEPVPDPEAPQACAGDEDCGAGQACSASGFCGHTLDFCTEVLDCVAACEDSEEDEGVAEEGQGGGPGEEGDSGPNPCMLDCFSRAKGDAINPLIRTFSCAVRCEEGPDGQAGEGDDCFNNECGAQVNDCLANEQAPLTCAEGVSCMQYCMLIGDDGGCVDWCMAEITQDGPDRQDFDGIVECMDDQCQNYPGPIDRCAKERCDKPFGMCMGGGDHEGQDPMEERPRMLFETSFDDPNELNRSFDVVSGEWRIQDGELVQNGGCPDCNERMAMIRGRQSLQMESDVYRFGYTITLPSVGGTRIADAFGAVHADCGNLSPSGCADSNMLRRLFGFRHGGDRTDIFVGGESMARMQSTPFSPAPNQRVRFELTCRPSEAEWRIMAEFPHGWDTMDTGKAWNQSLCTMGAGNESGRLLLGAERGVTRFDDVFFELPACWSRDREQPFEDLEGPCGVVSYLSYDGWLNNNIYDAPPEWERDHELVEDRHGDDGRALRIRDDRALEYRRPRGMDSQTWTMEAWIRPEGPNGRTQRIIDDRNHGGGPGGDDAAPRGRYMAFDSRGDLVCGFGTTRGQSREIRMPGPRVGQWSYVACGFDGEQLVITVNDESGDLRVPVVAAEGPYEPNTTGTLHVGGAYYGGDMFNGDLDEILIHEFAKSRNYMSRRAGM